MITVPVEAADYLPYVMDTAASEGYLGLMVVLARTAEARSLHEELTRDWTSIHDVTGHALAVLCPEPRFVRRETRRAREVPGMEPAEQAAYHAEALRTHRLLSRSALRDFPPFDYTRLVAPGSRRPPGMRRTPLPEHPPQEHHAAWTEAVARCARFFGVPERRLPALLVLCLREERGVLIQLREDTGVYRLCKEIASHPGYPPEDGELLRERDRLREAVRVRQAGVVRQAGAGHSAPRPPVRMREAAALAAVRKQTEGLWRHLELVADVDAGLGREVQDGLGSRVESDAALDDVAAWLSALARRLAVHPRRHELLHLDRKLRKLAGALEESARLGERRSRAAQEEELGLRRGRAALEELERRLAERRGLAGACEDAARAVLGDCRTEPLDEEEYRLLPGRRHRTEHIRVVRPVGPAPHPADDAGGTRNTLSGTTVHGSAVQARSIGALHLHVHGGAETGKGEEAREAKRGPAAWLRGALGRRRSGRSPE